MVTTRRAKPATITSYLTVADLSASWGLSRSTVRQYVKTRGFPAPLALSRRTLRWDPDEVREWQRTARFGDPLPKLGPPPPTDAIPVIRANRRRGAVA